MKRYLLLGLPLLFLLYLSLTGCVQRYPGINVDLTRETWMREVDGNPMKWTRGADSWFLTGDPNGTELSDRNAPFSAAISTMSIRVPDFTAIKVKGDFQVQIFGTYGPNSVYVYGPNDGVRQVIIDVQSNMLCITQSRKVSPSMRKVIIRIGIRQLSSLVQEGCGTIEGIRVQSFGLSVASRGSGNIYLSGNMCVRRVMNVGPGSISLFGANTPNLAIRTSGRGSVNVSGNVGIHSILHHGTNDINIIGANSNDLRIFADGSGKIGIKGIVGLREVRAHDLTRVFACSVRSGALYASAYNRAHIGLAGSAGRLHIEAVDSSCFSGKYLCAIEAFVRARNNSHVNVTAANKIFAAADQNSTVYFFGSPRILSQFLSGNGTVIPLLTDNGTSCTIVVVPSVARVSYKDEVVSYKGEAKAYPRTTWHKLQRWQKWQKPKVRAIRD